MGKGRRQHTAEYKAKVALEAAKGQKTLGELASEYGLHPAQISQWKVQLVENAAAVFRERPSREEKQKEEKEAQLYEKIGRLEMELDWLKKKS